MPDLHCLQKKQLNFLYLMFPLLVLFYKIISAENKKDYHFASNLSKIIMLAGIMYALVANYIINQSTI